MHKRYGRSQQNRKPNMLQWLREQKEKENFLIPLKKIAEINET